MASIAMFNDQGVNRYQIPKNHSIIDPEGQCEAHGGSVAGRVEMLPDAGQHRVFVVDTWENGSFLGLLGNYW